MPGLLAEHTQITLERVNTTAELLSQGSMQIFQYENTIYSAITYVYFNIGNLWIYRFFGRSSQ